MSPSAPFNYVDDDSDDESDVVSDGMSDGVSDGEVDEDSGFVMPRDRNSPSSIQDFNQAEYSDTGYGMPKDAPSDIPKSYNEMFLETIFKYANMDDHWELCVFDDELSRDSSDGGDSTRINVNENYIEKFSNFPKAAARIEKLRHFIYGDSIYGGSSDTEMRSGSLDQETFRINWQRIYTSDDSFHIFWYTTVLSNAHMYVPQLNQTEHENFDTEMNVVAYPAVFRQEQFGNDIMVIKKQFTDYKQLLASVKELRPPLDGRRPTRAIKSRQMIDNYIEPPFVQRLEKQRDSPTARPFSRNEERARERNLKQTRAREIGNKAEARLYNGADDEDDPVPHSGMVSTMSDARRENAMKAVQARLYGENLDVESDDSLRNKQSVNVNHLHKQRYRDITGEEYDPTDPLSRGWMKDMIKKGAHAGYNALKSGAKSAGNAAHAAKEHVKAKVHKMTAQQFDVVKSHGWLPPPPEGYGEDADDDITAQERVQDNHVAMKRAMMDLHNVKYNHKDKESRLFMEDMKSGALQASEANQVADLDVTCSPRE